MCVFYGDRKDGPPRLDREERRITGLFASEWYDDGCWGGYVLKLIKISCTNKSIRQQQQSLSRLCVMPLTFWLHFKTKAPTIRIFIALFSRGSFMAPFWWLPPKRDFQQQCFEAISGCWAKGAGHSKIYNRASCKLSKATTLPSHSVWKSPKMSHLNFSILAFFTIFWPTKTDLSGNSCWPRKL